MGRWRGARGLALAWVFGFGLAAVGCVDLSAPPELKRSDAGEEPGEDAAPPAQDRAAVVSPPDIGSVVDTSAVGADSGAPPDAAAPRPEVAPPRPEVAAEAALPDTGPPPSDMPPPVFTMDAPVPPDASAGDAETDAELDAPADAPPPDASVAVDAPEDAPAPEPDAPPDSPPDVAEPDAPAADATPDLLEPDAPLLGIGAPCMTGGQCQSGECADNVCCSSACTGVCQACNVAGSIGTCTFAPAGQDPHNSCDPDPVATCGRDGQCNGAGVCRLYAMGTPCASQTCVGSTETGASACNGSGMCVAGAVRDCSPYACSSNACVTTCSMPAHCKTGYWCNGGRCVPDGLLLYWKLDEPDGTVAQDSSGSAYNGTYTGMTGMPAPSTMVPTLQFADPRSRAFLLAERHAVRFANMPAPLKPVRDITLSAWYRSTMLDTNGGEVISGGDQYILRLGGATTIEFAKRVSNMTGGGIWVQCYATVTGALDGNWHHIAGVSSATGMKVYMDGVEKCTNTEARDILYDLPTGTDFWVGRHGTDGAPWDFEGNIDEVRVYGRALSATEIATLAAGGGN